RWLHMNAVGLDVSVEDVSERTAALALQGPRSRDVLSQLSPADFSALKYFRLTHTTLAGVPVTISRTGYTGDLGHEIWVDASRATRGEDARTGVGVRGNRGELGVAGAVVRRARPRARAADGGVADERSRIPRRQTDRLRDERLLVAAPQEVHRPGAPARAALR